MLMVSTPVVAWYLTCFLSGYLLLASLALRCTYFWDFCYLWIVYTHARTPFFFSLIWFRAPSCLQDYFCSHLFCPTSSLSYTDLLFLLFHCLAVIVQLLFIVPQAQSLTLFRYGLPCSLFWCVAHVHFSFTVFGNLPCAIVYYQLRPCLCFVPFSITTLLSIIVSSWSMSPC